MRWIRTPPRPGWPRSIVAWPAWVLLAFLYGPTSARPALAATPSQETLIQVLFGDLADPGGLDANGDRALTVADIPLLPPAIPPTPTDTRTETPTAPFTPTPSATVSLTPTSSPTMTLTPTPSPTVTLTPTLTPTATITPTPSSTGTETPTPTPVGLLFAGTIAELVPHAVDDQLVYRVTDPMAKVTTETTNVISEDAQGGFVVDDQVVSGQQLQSRQRQSYTDTGDQLLFGGFMDLFFTPHTTTTCTPPLLRLTTPLVAGQTFSTTVRCEVRFSDSGVFIGFVNRTDTFTPKEVVDSLTVVAGTFTSVVHISGATDQSGQQETDEIYVAPGVGPILQLQFFSGQLYRHELTSGTIGGHPVGQ